MPATWDTIDRYVVISTDTHAGADLHDYKQYLPAALHDEFDAWAKTYVSPFDDLIIATASRNWDSELRIADMDADGVAAEVLLPNTVPPFFPTTPNITISLPRTRDEFEKRWAGVQAHNRWQIDFCSLAPARRRGLIQIFPNDVELAMEEIRWGAEQTASAACSSRRSRPGDPQVAPLFHTRYEPLWALCADLDLTVVQHAGAGSPEMPMDQPASNAVLITEMALWANRTLGHLILAGVFERYPTLRFVPTEQGTLWVPAQLGILDAMVPTMKSEAGNRTYGMFGGSSVDELTMTPSEYVQRNCYLASELAPFDSGDDRFHGPGTHHVGQRLSTRRRLHAALQAGHPLGPAQKVGRRLPKDPGRQRRSAVPIRPRCTRAGRRKDRADSRRGAHAARGHRLSRTGRIWLPAV